MRVRFHDLVIDESFLSARRDDGTELRFTRQERALLRAFAQRPQRLFTRRELVELLTSDGSERVVDFVMARLRAKLGDRARAPRFIATQYGEGYVWIAPPQPVLPMRSFLVVGPSGGGGAEGAAAVRRLAEALRACAPGREIREDPAWARGDPPGERPRFSLEVRFHDGGQVLHAAVVLREEPAGRAVRSLHRALGAETPPAAMTELATELLDAAWEALALGPREAPAPADPPLHLRMHEAARVLGNGEDAPWAANRPPLQRARSRSPGDARLAIMSALQLVAGLVLYRGPEPLSSRLLEPIEDEIERLALSALEGVRGDPLLTLGAAKALFVVKRGHVDLAESLAQEAFASSAAFAAAFPLLAQVSGWRGDLGRAVRLYEEGWRLCEKGTEFEIYILYLKASAHVAAGDRDAAAAVFAHLNRVKPVTRVENGPQFVPPWGFPVDADLARQMDEMDLAEARRIIAYQRFMIARNFADPAHAASVMEGPLSQLVRRFGPGVASDEIWAALGDALGHLRQLAPA